jgi:signal transduction histidine kinase/ActR/RegA family two-component response regulator
MDVRPAEDEPEVPIATPSTRQDDAALARHQRKDGTVIDVEIVSHELEMDGRRARLVMLTDISDRARARAALHHSQEELRHAQRLDAVGRLASGIAYDFNNILTTIRGFSDLLHRQLAEDDPRRADADQIRKAADRGVLLTGQLLSFGQRQEVSPRLLDLHQTIHLMEGLIRRLLGADIRLDLRLMRGAAMVRMDPGHLDQMLVNLILNARDAMPQGGILTIETAERQIGAGPRSRRVRPGTYLLLAIRDTGTAEDTPRATESDPFRQPDPRDQRAGLGLSIVHGIVRQNGGVVRVSSESEEGTTVKVYLPKADAEESPGLPSRPKGNETVLVVEDEDGVRELIHQVLVEQGYAVLTARHGRDALLLAERYERPIHLLVTDVVMPEMGGGELADRLTARRPDLKVLYISGYSNDEVLRRGVHDTGTRFLHKPFTSEGLVERVREAVEGTHSTAT